VHVHRRREGVADEEVGDLVVLAARQQDPVRSIDAAAGPADLLVVGDRAPRSLVVDDEPQVRLVEAHAERDRRDERLDLARDQGVLEGLALRRCELRVVGAGIDAARPQPGRDPLRVGDGQAVDDAAAGQVRDVLREPRKAFRLVGEGDGLQPK
jgi:hypothetical protein